MIGGGGYAMSGLKHFLPIVAGCVAAMLATMVLAQDAPVKVNLDNYVRATSDGQFDGILKLSGGVNRWFHFREPTPVDNQPVIRINRDTLYSANIVDISEGATVTMPETGGRYQTVMIVSQDHYIWALDKSGTYELTQEKYGTPWILVAGRTFVDPNDPADVDEVHALQDALKIEAKSSKPFEHPKWDAKSMQRMYEGLAILFEGTDDTRNMFGSKDQVTETRWMIGAATGWGGLPNDQAMYILVSPNLPVGDYKIEVPAEVPVGAFWSVSVYNKDGFFEKNDLGVYNISSVTGEKNPDGTMTVHLGGCEDGRVNCIPITEGWNYNVRLYKPGPEVLDGTWKFPAVEPAR
jgi:hypothetical protein